MKKIFTLTLLVALVFGLAACSKKKAKVTFDAQNGEPLTVVEVLRGEYVEQPEDPKAAKNAEGNELNFLGWYKEADGKTRFNFVSTKITEDVTVYGVWVDDVVIRFNTKTETLINPLTVLERDLVSAPNEPTRDGFIFKGWFEGKAGLTWLELEPVEFPLTASRNLNLNAYWEPVSSELVNWSANETYRSTITKQSRMILNPLTYENSLENDLISNMATSLYSTEVDWDDAIAKGVASFPGDFSKFESGEFSIEALDYKSILVGAAGYPLNADGDDLLDENGEYDRDAATTVTSREWTYRLRDDIFFQDGTKVTAETYDYTLKQYLDGKQNNYRANTQYRTEENKNGVPILNAYEYFSQSVVKMDGEEQVRDEEGKLVYEDKVVEWADVGIEIIDDYTFKMTFHEPYSQAAAVSFGALRLVHPTKYAASLDPSGNSSYGTPNNPYVSYGAYVLKSWDEDQKLVFNKNYNYVAKGTINYKSTVYELVDNPEQALNLFKEGSIDVIGLNAENFEQFSESENIYKSFTGYPMFLSVNTAPSKLESSSKHVPDTILFDVKFRQALMYAFDRVDFNTNFDIPNLPSFIPVPGDIKNYVQDSEFFTDSVEYLEVLEKIGVDPETYGYMPTKGLELFDQAYDAWLAEGNTGPATLKLIAGDSTIQKKLSERIKATYESFFEKGGQKRLVIDVHNLASEQKSQTSAAWDFDLTLGGIGFGGSLGSYWQMGAISFAGGLLGGASLGLSQPYTTGADGKQVLAPYAEQLIEVDLTSTYNFLVSKGGETYLDEEELDNTKILFEWLQEEVDGTGAVVKPAGILRAEVLEVATWLMSGDEPWDGTAKEPFTGASVDANRMAAAMLEVFYEHVTHIPTGTSASATLYADKVTVLWPEYSTAFGWGAARYRFLNTDSDFS